MILSYMLALCLCGSLFSQSYAGYMELFHTDPSTLVNLPLGGTMPAVHVYDINLPESQRANDGSAGYFFILRLQGNETFRIDTQLCPGCTLQISTCAQAEEGDTCLPYLIDFFNEEFSDPGWYVWWVILPAQETWIHMVTHRKLINGMWVPSILYFRIHNTWAVSSTGPSVTWPMGRVTGLYIEDGVSSAFLPHSQDGWDWIEYDRDLSNYTFEVGFVTHLMTYDAFYIEPTFEDAIYVSTKLNDTIASSNYLGTSSNPITDEYTIYRYHFNIPIGGTSEIRLHYLYQMPGQSNLNELLFVVRITNAYGLPPNSLPQRTSMSSRQPEVQLSLDQSTQHSSQQSPSQNLDHFMPASLPENVKQAIREAKESALKSSALEPSSTGVNGVSSATINALAVALCAVVASFML